MKKAIRLMIVLGVMLTAFTACDKESVISAEGLPKEAQLYINQHFPDREILQVVKERDDMKTTYDVYLDGGFNLDFNKNGKIIGVEGSGKLPDSVVPAQLLTYVNTNYPDVFIRGWELDDRGQEVKLANGMDLLFDMNGNFLRID